MKKPSVGPKFSTAEYVGLAMMIAGVVMGCYLTILSEHRFRQGNAALEAMMTQLSQPLKQPNAMASPKSYFEPHRSVSPPPMPAPELGSNMLTSMQSMGQATTLTLWSAHGNWIFLAGLGLFIITGRTRRDQVIPAMPAD